MTLFKIYFLPFSYIKLGFKSEQVFVNLNSRHLERKKLLNQRLLLVEKGFSTLRMKPFSVIKVKIMSISMPWINLFNSKKLISIMVHEEKRKQD